MRIHDWPKQQWLRVTFLLSALLVVPYGFSRLASTWRCLSVHSTPDVGVTKTHTPELPLRIACYNIAHGRGVAPSNWAGGNRVERIDRLDQIATLLRRIDADVVILNEVDFDSSWSYSVNQARYLAEEAGYPHWTEQRNLDFRVLMWTWRFGNAVLSRFPIMDAQVADLPGYATWETILAGKKRGTVCDIILGDQAVRVIGAHLSHRSEPLRVKSATVLVQIAAESRLPTIVAGDLNSTPPGFPNSVADSNGNNAIEVFDNSGRFQRSPTNQLLTDNDLTYLSVEPRSVIDWILIPHNWHFLQYSVELSRLSDHRPVYADAAPNSTGATSVVD